MKEADPKLDNFIKEKGFNHEAFADDMKANFDEQDLARFAGLISMYEPLLQRALLLNSALSNHLDNDSQYKKAVDEWVLDYRALNETVRALHDKETLN